MLIHRWLIQTVETSNIAQRLLKLNWKETQHNLSAVYWITVLDQRVNDLSLVKFHVDKEPRSNVDNAYLFFLCLILSALFYNFWQCQTEKFDQKENNVFNNIDTWACLWKRLNDKCSL